MTAQEWIEELEWLSKAATPGPWAYEQHGDTNECGVGVILDNNNGQVAGENSDPTLFVAESIAPEVNSVTNAAYIVAACNAVPRLTKMLRFAVSIIEAQREQSVLRGGKVDTTCDVMQALFTMTGPKE